MAVERVLSNLNLISFKTEEGLQNHIDELQDGDLVFTPDNSLKGNLFDFKWTDHKLEDMSWLNADTFSWQSGDVYVAAYNHLEKDVESGGLYYRWSTRSDAAAGYNRNIKTRTPTVGEKFYTATDEGWVDTGVTVAQIIDENTVVDSEGATLYWLGNMTNLPADRKEETISGTTVTYFQAEDGHKICLPDQESNVQALYEATGVAWYYILDTANKQFKLPRTKFGFTGLRDEVGGYVEAGLPNITGKFCVPATYGSATSSGVFNTYNGGSTGSTNTAAKAGDLTVQFNASSSSSVYGNSNTVQPKATQMYLYFYVGNFERDAIEQTAGITSEQLNNKLDKSAETYLVPSGAVSAFAGTTAPTGWLKCDGSAISRTTYSALFNVIGTTYGTGDGSTTFNLPTQSVLPLGTSATVKLTRPPTNKKQILRLQNDGYSYTWNKGSQYSMGLFSESSDGVMKQETTDGTYNITLLDPNGTMYADIAAATGAKAIVCIKY